MKTEFLHMDLSITDSHFLNSENYIHTSVCTEYYRKLVIKLEDKSTVDVSKLERGIVAKNYKDMCLLLGCKPCKGTGTDKECQIKNWQRYFNFKKAGHKFIVTEVYDTPLPQSDARKVKEGKYNKYIELLLLRYVSACENNMLEITKRGLYKVLGMVNESYDKVTYDNCVEAIQDDMGHKISRFNINHFHQRVENKFSKILYNTLDSMEKRKLIHYRKKIIITADDGYNLENGGSITALPYQEGIIEDMFQKVLDEWGYSNIAQVNLRYKTKEFYDEVNKRLNDEYEWKGFYTHILISMLDCEDAQHLLAEDIRGLSSSVQREQFNKLLIEDINGQVDSKYEKYQNETVEDICDGKVKGFRYNESYLEAQKELSDYLLSLKYEDKYKSFWLSVDK